MRTRPLKLLVIAGARPNFIKVAPLIKAVQRHNAVLTNGQAGVECRLIHTGQHYDARMSQIFFEELGIPTPDYNLGVGSGSHAAQTANVMLKFEPVCLAEKPDWVIVVGDVNSTLACTIVAAKMGVRVAHVEAGLRSFDRSMPEEINRIITDSIADLLLTPSEDADQNLLREGIPVGRIRLVGNIMIDALRENLHKARQSKILESLDVRPVQFVYVTLHRPQNVDCHESLSSIIAELRRLAGLFPVVFPMHPRTRKMISDFGITWTTTSSFKVIEPVGYHDSLCLTENARLILTDSGGLQEESTFFRTPCLTLRPNTERPVTVDVGSNRLTSIGQLADDFDDLLAKPARLGRLPYCWNGRTSVRILQAVIEAHSASSAIRRAAALPAWFPPSTFTRPNIFVPILESAPG